MYKSADGLKYTAKFENEFILKEFDTLLELANYIEEFNEDLERQHNAGITLR